MFLEMARNHTPEYHYHGQEFEAWKQTALPEVMATLGEMPPPGEFQPELILEWEHDHLRKQKWHIEVSPFSSAVFQINFSLELDKNKKHPAILCCHGHDKNGKEEIMGNVPDEKLSAAWFGHELAKQGFVTFAIDWLGKGERNDNTKPNHYAETHGRDWCNLYYLHATMLGMTTLGINIAHGQRAIDFASTFKEVDRDRFGVMGWSAGGTMSLWLSLADSRIRATEIISYSDLWECFGIRDLNYCGWQIAPGLFKLVNLPELQGLLAPRPLLIDIGVHDECFKIDSATACFKQLERIYSAAAAGDKLRLNLHPGGHGGWSLPVSKNFFNENL